MQGKHNTMIKRIVDVCMTVLWCDLGYEREWISLTH